ncbi:MAG: cytochrome C [Nitrospirae bacterium RBG_13_41_22]|nr:MAG: cytochrome C [Nitrospirae bacterium RBG_13_41_22]
MSHLKFAIGFLALYSVICLIGASGITYAEELIPIEQLGKELFFDENLSTPPVQSCAACHAPEAGFTGPDSYINATQAIYPGAVHTRAGNRKPPTAAYGGDSPVMYYDEIEGLWIGGMFWDGRATGWTLGDPLAEQALGPFLNPLEQNSPVARLVLIRVANSHYAGLFEEVWGPGSLDFKKDIAKTYERIGRSIAAYERSVEVNPFSSKFDLFWDNVGDEATVKAINMSNWEDYKGQGLEDNEVRGLALFNDETKGKCSLCHVLDSSSSGYPVFTDFTYDNLGIPKNLLNPFYSLPKKWNPDGWDWIDSGLGGFLATLDESFFISLGLDMTANVNENHGKHKVPTLRNVDKRPYTEFVKSYGHNGYFKSLEAITHFYNTRDVEVWPPPEVAENINTDELGNLGLTPEEEAAVVAFMRTLTDGYIP